MATLALKLIRRWLDVAPSNLSDTNLRPTHIDHAGGILGPNLLRPMFGIIAAPQISEIGFHIL